MTRTLVAVLMLCSPLVAPADDLKISRLEADVRELRLQLQEHRRQLDALRLQPPQGAPVAAPPRSPDPAASRPLTWLDAARWRLIHVNMTELEVVAELGPPTSMRNSDGQRVLLYAMEIGASGFLAGSVSFQDGRVVEAQLPTLR